MARPLFLAALVAGGLQFAVPTAHACPPQNLNVNDCAPENTTGIPDPVLCPIFASVVPGLPGVIEVSSDGDISLAGQPFWDCPPYDDV